MNVDLPQSLSLPTCIHLSSREWQAMQSVQIRDKCYNREGEEQFTCSFMKKEDSESMQWVRGKQGQENYFGFVMFYIDNS